MRILRATLPTLLTLAACQTVPATRMEHAAPVAGAPTPQAAVAMFVSGMRQYDLATIGEVWGTRDGLMRDRYPREAFEKRAFVASCYIGWSSYQIVNDRPAADQARVMTIRSTTPGHEKQTTMRLERGWRGRWFVVGFDPSTLPPDNCRQSASVGR